MTFQEVRDPFTRHVHLVDTVAGIAPPPKAWAELRDRFDAFLTFDATPIRDRLIAAVVGGGAEDVPTLKALATAESWPEKIETITAVRGAVYPRLVQAYSAVATANYARVAKAFDAVAAKFAAAAERCEPEADSTAVVSQPDSVRNAWLDAERFAGDLDELVPPLCAAAELAGISTAEDGAVLPLVCDPAGLHRRRVWQAFKSAGARCGRWSALAALGARIRACELDDFEPYREPKPLVRRQFPAPGPDNRGIYQTITVDPEDDPDADIEVLVKQRRAALTR